MKNLLFGIIKKLAPITKSDESISADIVELLGAQDRAHYESGKNYVFKTYDCNIAINDLVFCFSCGITQIKAPTNGKKSYQNKYDYQASVSTTHDKNLIQTSGDLVKSSRKQFLEHLKNEAAFILAVIYCEKNRYLTAKIKKKLNSHDVKNLLSELKADLLSDGEAKPKTEKTILKDGLTFGTHDAFFHYLLDEGWKVKPFPPILSTFTVEELIAAFNKTMVNLYESDPFLCDLEVNATTKNLLKFSCKSIEGYRTSDHNSIGFKVDKSFVCHSTWEFLVGQSDLAASKNIPRDEFFSLCTHMENAHNGKLSENGLRVLNFAKNQDIIKSYRGKYKFPMKNTEIFFRAAKSFLKINSDFLCAKATVDNILQYNSFEEAPKDHLQIDHQQLLYSIFIMHLTRFYFGEKGVIAVLDHLKKLTSSYSAENRETQKKSLFLITYYLAVNVHKIPLQEAKDLLQICCGYNLYKTQVPPIRYIINKNRDLKDFMKESFLLALSNEGSPVFFLAQDLVFQKNDADPDDYFNNCVQLHRQIWINESHTFSDSWRKIKGKLQAFVSHDSPSPAMIYGANLLLWGLASVNNYNNTQELLKKIEKEKELFLKATIRADYLTRIQNHAYMSGERTNLHLPCGPIRFLSRYHIPAEEKYRLPPQMSADYKSFLLSEQGRYVAFILRLLSYTDFNFEDDDVKSFLNDFSEHYANIRFLKYDRMPNSIEKNFDPSDFKNIY